MNPDLTYLGDIRKVMDIHYTELSMLLDAQVRHREGRVVRAQQAEESMADLMQT